MTTRIPTVLLSVALGVHLSLAPAVAESEGGGVVVTRREGTRLEVVVAGVLILESPAAQEGELMTLATGAETVLPRLEEDLGLRLRRAVRIYLLPAASRQSPEERALDGLAPPWAAGYVLAGQRVGAIRLESVDRYPYRDALSVLGHELTHLLLDDGVGERLPTWFEEGVATWLGRRWGLRDALVLTSGLLIGELPPLDRINGMFHSSSSQARLAYAASFDFVEWTLEHHGDDVIARIVQRVAAGQPFVEAWETAVGESLASSEARWRKGSVLLYRWVPLVTGSGTLWLAITLLALVAGVRRRRRSRRLLEEWGDEPGEDGVVEDGNGSDGRDGGGWVH